MAYQLDYHRYSCLAEHLDITLTVHLAIWMAIQMAY